MWFFIVLMMVVEAAKPSTQGTKIVSTVDAGGVVEAHVTRARPVARTQSAVVIAEVQEHGDTSLDRDDGGSDDDDDADGGAGQVVSCGSFTDNKACGDSTSVVAGSGPNCICDRPSNAGCCQRKKTISYHFNGYEYYVAGTTFECRFFAAANLSQRDADTSGMNRASYVAKKCQQWQSVQAYCQGGQIGTFTGKTVEECKEECISNTQCVKFEHGTDCAGSTSASLCRLFSSSLCPTTHTHTAYGCTLGKHIYTKPQ